MEMNLPALAAKCNVSGVAFAEGDRVVSLLMRGDKLEAVRYDVREDRLGELAPAGTLICKWAREYKPREKAGNTERALKLTAESLFTTLADPLNEPSAENDRLARFLALLLERKRILRARGLTPDGGRVIYEHTKSKVRYEVSAAPLDPGFFLAVKEQLSVLVAEPVAAVQSADQALTQEPAAS